MRSRKIGDFHQQPVAIVCADDAAEEAPGIPCWPGTSLDLKKFTLQVVTSLDILGLDINTEALAELARALHIFGGSWYEYKLSLTNSHGLETDSWLGQANDLLREEIEHLKVVEPVEWSRSGKSGK